MLYVRLVDDDGFFLEDSFVEKLTRNTIETPCPDGFYRPRWNFDTQQWEEGGVAPEPIPQELTDVEKLKIRTEATESAIDGIMMMLMGGMM